MTIERRNFLRGAAVTVGGLAAASIAPTVAGAADPKPEQVAFHGPHQAGILTPRQNHAAFLAFDLTATTRAELVELMKTLTERARFLATGGTPPQLGISAPPLDSGILGPTVTPDSLSITVGLGASLFDDRFGLSNAKPVKLRQMDVFPDDDIDRARSDGDLLVQVCAAELDTVLHAVRDLARHTRGGMQARWRLDGFAGPPRPTGAPRNLLGFKDGTANPDPSDTGLMRQLVWVGDGRQEPGWASGGSYQVV
ncbi:Dyp-type peroxidase, partial [Jatrophihabitans sp.]|uniref:Dyp-type peroxidase n=1 Tax=Jatrophihabitans sp. TaxID=1932789 RepID=UPI0030C71A2D|nr:efeB [Jatrophihabitans sp.]